MGEPVIGGELKSFVGISRGKHGDDARLDEALMSAAAEVVKAGLVGPEKTAWFNLSGLEIEIGNQHVKTFKATVTQGSGGGGSR